MNESEHDWYIMSDRHIQTGRVFDVEHVDHDKSPLAFMPMEKIKWVARPAYGVRWHWWLRHPIQFWRLRIGCRILGHNRRNDGWEPNICKRCVHGKWEE